MRRSQVAKSTVKRLPLSDVSNGRPRQPGSHRRKAPPPAAADAALDRLLLTRSELAAIVSQIDELLAQALQSKTISGRGNQEIETFSRCLSRINSSLKPWSSRLKQAFEACPEESDIISKQTMGTCSVSALRRNDNLPQSGNDLPDTDLIVSPSPLVSWHAGSCMVESGKQLFLLTPLPKTNVSSSTCPRSKTSMKMATDTDQLDSTKLPIWKVSISDNNHVDIEHSMKVKEARSVVLTPHVSETKGASDDKLFSPLSFSTQKSRNASFMSLPSPCPKTALSSKQQLLAPISEGSSNGGADNSGPTQSGKLAEDDDLSAGEVSKNVTSRYPDLLGLNQTSRLTSRRQEIDDTLHWFLSPPKTCVLLNPSDEKPIETPADNSKAMLGTPWKGLESTNMIGRHAGETTLKKELWTRFEAISTNELHLDKSVFQKTQGKRLLEMLEDAS